MNPQKNTIKEKIMIANAQIRFILLTLGPFKKI
jgi:hypothetical protein